MKTESSDITGLILCGGAGSRMGGIDKGLMPFHGKPLVDIAIERLRSQVTDILLSANRNERDYAARGYRVLKDEPLRDDGPGYEGPLAGILSGLRHCPTSWMMVVPCDAPMFPHDIALQLMAGLSQSSNAAHVKGHPTFALIHVSHRAQLEHYLQHGERKLGKWLADIGSAAIDGSDEACFRNLNTPQDLAQ